MDSWLFLSEIESRRFGFNVVRSRIDKEPPPVERILEDFTAFGADIAVLRFEAANRLAPARLSSSGMRVVLADTLVYYATSLDRDFNYEIVGPVTIRRACSNDLPQVAHIAEQGFRGYTSHYDASACFERAKVEEGYVEWAVNHAKSTDPCDDTWLVEVGGQAMGFATCRRRPDGSEVEILLNAVAPSAQGRGLYRHLVAGIASAYREDGIGRLIISTQVWNTRVQRAWVALGLAPERAYNTFHLGA